MSKPTVLIFCSGTAVRWDDDTTHKQLALVEDVPLLHRTIAQLKKRGIRPVIVATDPATFTLPDTDYFHPSASRYWVETVLSTRNLWKGQMVALLGDVFFSEGAMNDCIAADGLHFFGRIQPSYVTGGCAEVFAMSWGDEDHGALTDALAASLKHAVDKGGDRDQNGSPVGSPWQPYRLLSGLAIDDHAVDSKGIWINRNDFTDDFDTQAHYKFWCERYAQRWICQRAS